MLETWRGVLESSRRGRLHNASTIVGTDVAWFSPTVPTLGPVAGFALVWC